MPTNNWFRVPLRRFRIPPTEPTELTGGGEFLLVRATREKQGVAQMTSTIVSNNGFLAEAEWCGDCRAGAKRQG